MTVHGGSVEGRHHGVSELPLDLGCDPKLQLDAIHFHEANPHILSELADVCLRVKRAGRRRWSVKAAFEVVRYNRLVTTRHTTYKLNNNFTAFYARWLMALYPELEGFFVLRTQLPKAQFDDRE